MTFVPKRDYIVVEPVSEEQRVGSIYLPDSAKKGNKRGVVRSVGQGRWNSQHQTFNGFSVNVGDVVLFNEFAGLELQVEGQEFVVIRDADVIGVFVE